MIQYFTLNRMVCKSYNNTVLVPCTIQCHEIIQYDFAIVGMSLSEPYALRNHTGSNAVGSDLRLLTSLFSSAAQPDGMSG